MRRFAATLLAMPLALVTYALLMTTDKVASNAPGTCYGGSCTSMDAGILMVAWWFLILLWCPVLWMLFKRRRRT